MPTMEISAAKLIADLNRGDYKQYESELHDLKIFQMDDARFEEILEIFFEKKLLSKIKSLDVSGNGLQFLPERIGDCAQLSTLRLSDNQFKALSEAIGKLTELKFLYASYNLLEALPEALWNCGALEHLNVEHNVLKTLGEDIGLCLRLKRLFAMDNKLERVPPSIGRCRALEVLSLEENPLLPTAPRTIDKLQSQWEILQDMTVRSLDGAYLYRVRTIADFFATLQCQMPVDLLKTIVSYVDYGVKLMSPAPELLEKKLREPLRELFEAHKRRNMGAEPITSLVDAALKLAMASSKR